MKFLIVFLAVFAVVFADSDEHHEEEWKPKNSAEIKEIRAECVNESGLTEELIIQMKQFIFPDEAPVRKYLTCAAIKMGIFSTEKGYHVERVAKQFKTDLEEAEVIEIVKGCVEKHEEGEAADVWAFRGHICVMSSKVGDKVKAFIKKRMEEAAKKAAEENKL